MRWGKVPLKKVESKPITIHEVRDLLKNLNRELNHFQRKTLEYTLMFSKLDGEKAKELTKKITEEFDVNIKEAIQIVNCMPKSVEELRVFFPRHKVIEPEKLKKILKLLDEYK
ncbi:MAG: hypothetical protein ACKD6N_01385 [Candidatus Bathyarchaeota archaeon]